MVSLVGTHGPWKSSRRLRLTSLSIPCLQNGVETGADNLIGYIVKILGTVSSSEHDSTFC
jgi:hypothetical protein